MARGRRRRFPCQPHWRPGPPDCCKLAGELGGLPLALEQAVAYIQAAGDSLASYLALFRQRRSHLLARATATG